MNRRAFIQRTSLGTAAVVSGIRTPLFSQNPKVKIGLIGSGWYGMVITKAALKAGGVEVIAVCDVDSEHLKKSIDEIESLQGNRPKGFKNYPDLLNMDGVEAVLIGTGTRCSSLPLARKDYTFIAKNRWLTM